MTIEDFKFEIIDSYQELLRKKAAYVIMNKNTGKQWRACSGKTVWTSIGAAKGAFANSHYRASHDLYMLCRQEGCSKIPLFDTQDELEILTIEEALIKYVNDH